MLSVYRDIKYLEKNIQLPFIKHSNLFPTLRTAKLFANVILFNSLHILMLLSLFYGWGTKAPRTLSKLPKNRADNGRGQVPTQVADSLIQCAVLPSSDNPVAMFLTS